MFLFQKGSNKIKNTLVLKAGLLNANSSRISISLGYKDDNYKSVELSKEERTGPQ